MLTSQGFSLIEILIAFFVLSIGLLGLAGLQATSARHNNDAKVRATASFAAGDVVNKIYSRIMLLSPTERETLIKDYETTTAASTCDPSLSDIATDLACLKRQIETDLPGGKVTITDLNDRKMQITVEWYNRDEKRLIKTTWEMRL